MRRGGRMEMGVDEKMVKKKETHEGGRWGKKKKIEEGL